MHSMGHSTRMKLLPDEVPSARDQTQLQVRIARTLLIGLMSLVLAAFRRH